MTLDPAFLARPIAHRGLHGATHGRAENSLGAVSAAIEAGFGIELDLQLTRDQKAVMFHDPTLDRLTDQSGLVAEKDADELGSIRLGSTEDTIVTLDMVLERVAGRVPLLIELKDQTERDGGVLGPLEQATADALSGYGGPVAVMSFHPGMVANLAQLAPEIPRGLTGTDFTTEDVAEPIAKRLNAYADFQVTRSCFVSHDWHFLEMPAVSELKAQGASILCWTIRSPAEEIEARKIADNITFEGYMPT
ncbi:MAG: glycerophosphodiester phosphodiesterase family protein [Pseudomonadota bacterium]